MGEKGNISLYRDMLDKTLASEELKNEETLKTLVKNQILKSSQFEFKEHIENVVGRRTKEVSNLLGMLRSASLNDAERLKLSEGAHGAWKVKQDTEEFRVMYREGPEGTPFHTLLVEGYVDGPVDVCLCISLESALYKKWWPQSAIPAFRITSSQCLQKVRIGEQISLVRMKVSWPLSAREALIHYFEFEYFQDGLVVVLLNSISDLESIDKSTHGFTRDGIPDPNDVVRIDVVGGFALQKVSASRSYFRTIANMDIKLDLVPPAFINFVSRQLIGSGFKLYKKEVASVSQGDEDFGKALKDPLYEGVREALYTDNVSSWKRLEPEEIKHDGFVLLEEQPRKNIEGTKVEAEIQSDDQVTRTEITEVEEIQNHKGNLAEEKPRKYNEDAEVEKKVQIDGQVSIPAGDYVIGDKKILCEIEEIEEEDIEERKCVDEDSKISCNPQTNQITEKSHTNDKKKVAIHPEVKKALGTLEKAISIIREHKSNLDHESLSSITIEKPNLEVNATKESTSQKPDQICQNGGTFTGLSKKESTETTLYEPRNSSGSHGSRRTGSNSYAREANHSKVAPASPDEFVQDPVVTTVGDNVLNANQNIVNEETVSRKKNKKSRYCCLHRIYGQLVA